MDPTTSIANSSRFWGRSENTIIKGSSCPGLTPVFDLLSPRLLDSRFFMATSSMLESSISDRTFPQKNVSVFVRVFPFVKSFPLIFIDRREDEYQFLIRPVITNSFPVFALVTNLLSISKVSILRFPAGSETLGLR